MDFMVVITTFDMHSLNSLSLGKNNTLTTSNVFFLFCDNIFRIVQMPSISLTVSCYLCIIFQNFEEMVILP